MHDSRYPRANPWIRFAAPDPGAALRLFCFPYAGAGASVYRGWRARLPTWIHLCPIQLPGREERIREPPFTNMDALCAALLPALAPYLDMPIALFGHSMGALIAYQAATRLREQGGSPIHLLVSGQRAPHLPLGRQPSYDLPEAAFRERLRSLNGTPELVLQDPELMDLVWPLLRADFELSECTPRQPRDPLDCPVTAFGGLDDSEVRRSHLDAWRDTTIRDFELHMFPGDHFYLAANESDLTMVLAKRLAAS
jgi:medium-chain acyl-[acyl-carrier-protein] hydrolase